MKDRKFRSVRASSDGASRLSMILTVGGQSGALRFSTLWVAILLTVFSSTAFCNDPLKLDQNEIAFLKQASEEIIQRFPPERYYYVAVGRSPVPLVTYLIYGKGVEGSFLPATEARFSDSVRYVSEENARLLRKHFERFLPSSDKLEGRKLLLIDYTQRGMSLDKVMEYAKAFLTLATPPESLGIAYKRPAGLTDIDHWLITQDEQLDAIYSAQKYDDYAPFTRALLNDPKSLAGVKKNPRYQLLVNTIRSTLPQSASGCETLLQKIQRWCNLRLWFKGCTHGF